MKDIIKTAAGIKAYIGLIFGGEVLIYTAIKQWLFGETSISFSLIWQFLALAAFATLLQALCFGDYVFKSLRGPIRMVLFTAKLFCTVSLFAWLFNWFPMGDLRAWLIFGGLFLVFEGAVAMSFELYYRITGEHYTAKLEVYRQTTRKDA